MKIREIITREWRALWRGKLDLALMAVVMVCYTLLFGGLFMKNSVTALPIAVCDLDGGPAARSAIQSLRTADALSLYAVTTSPDEAEGMLAREEVVGVVVLPQDLSTALNTRSATRVLLWLNNGNTMLGSAVLSGVQSVVGTLNAEVSVREQLASGVSYQVATGVAQGITLSPRMLYNSTGGYVDFFLPLLLIHSLQIATVFILAPAFCVRRAEMAALPLAALAVRLGLLVLWELALLLGAMAIAALAFNMQLQLGVTAIALLFLFSLTLTVLAAAVGLLAPQPVLSIPATLLYIMPSILLSGGLWPRTTMDTFTYLLSYIVPIAFVGDTVRDLFQRGDSPLLATSFVGITTMLALFSVLLLVGRGRLRRAGHA